MLRLIDQLAGELRDHVIVAKPNVDENPLGAMKHQIQGIPTLKLFHKRIEVETFDGIQPLNKLKTAILRDAAKFLGK